MHVGAYENSCNAIFRASTTVEPGPADSDIELIDFISMESGVQPIASIVQDN